MLSSLKAEGRAAFSFVRAFLPLNKNHQSLLLPSGVPSHRFTKRARPQPVWWLPSRTIHKHDTAHLSRFEITRVRVADKMVGATPQLPPCCMAAGCSPATEIIHPLFVIDFWLIEHTIESNKYSSYRPSSTFPLLSISTILRKER